MKRCLLIALLIILSAPVCLWADDTEIYGTVTSTALEPNVLIIFDNSGSMDANDVPSEYYDPARVYDGSNSPIKVYYEKRYWWWTWWEDFIDDVNNIACESVKQSVLTKGWTEEYINLDSTCGGTQKHLRLGNYLNYLETADLTKSRRIDVAKDVITSLINKTEGVRFGLMVFKDDDDDRHNGGRLVAECGTDKTTLVNAIDALYPLTWTPLGETLAEAGLYFAGKDSWFNTGVNYTSPMQERCQKNYVIVMTDGQSTQDRDPKLTGSAYINGDTIGDWDNDHDGGSENDYGDNGSDYMDDVAKYLYENDCNPDLGDGTSFDKQRIVTYTIGFNLQTVSDQLLRDTAVNGGGKYYAANAVSDLEEAFDQIMSTIAEENAVFVAPVVPISRMNRTYAGDRIYLGFFKPQQSGRWIGNIKRYGLQSDGILLDAKGNEATTDDGLIKENTLSFWTSLGDDGANVEAGGVAEVLNLRIEAATARNIYTYTGSQAVLTHSSNAFVNANTDLTNTDLGVPSDTERLSLINSVYSEGLGDIIHSEPVVQYYPDVSKTIIYVGSNDGMLHSFDDDDGSEVWGFIPPSQLARLNLLNNDDHDYFVDGSPVIYDDGTQKVLIIGERRGGSSYTALDITSHSSPQYLYSIGPDILDPTPGDDTDSFEGLGQSWSKPERCTVATDLTFTASPSPACYLDITIDVEDIFLMAGGYDNNQDQETPAATDSLGRAVFGVNFTTGQVLSSLNINAVDNSGLGMTHSVVDVSGVDHDGDGIVSRIYFGDLGGNVFALKDDAAQDFTVCGETVSRVVVDGNWASKKLFSASADDLVQRKILYAPDVVEEAFGEYIYFGTGDRTNPGKTTVVDRFYAVKNDWSDVATLTESDLVDVSDNLIQQGNETEQAAAKADLENGSGWFLEMENTGEKVVSSPRVYGGIVYFTTYTPSPEEADDPEDPCVASTVRGIARLYALEYKTGAAVHDWNSDAVTNDAGDQLWVDKDGNVSAEPDLGNPAKGWKKLTLDKKDRALEIGTAIPSASVIAILNAGARLFVGVEGGIVSLPTIATQDMYRYFWNQVF